MMLRTSRTWMLLHVNDHTNIYWWFKKILQFTYFVSAHTCINVEVFHYYYFLYSSFTSLWIFLFISNRSYYKAHGGSATQITHILGEKHHCWPWVTTVHVTYQGILGSSNTISSLWLVFALWSQGGQLMRNFPFPRDAKPQRLSTLYPLNAEHQAR